jgi:hypothetical protein
MPVSPARIIVRHETMTVAAPATLLGRSPRGVCFERASRPRARSSPRPYVIHTPVAVHLPEPND